MGCKKGGKVQKSGRVEGGSRLERGSISGRHATSILFPFLAFIHSFMGFLPCFPHANTNVQIAYIL